jgi:conjugative relaxase-like TrwC/TraI family protein
MSAVAGSLTIGKGASPGYYTGQASRGTDYYAAGAGSEEPGSEPTGIWTGDGCADLGLEVGSEVDHETFARIFGSHTDPQDGSRIGRAMRYRDAEAIYGNLLDAEPGATAERRSELFAQAQAQAGRSRPVAFFDATFSVSKSITLLHASARAMKLAAQDAGDYEGASQAEVLEETVWRAISSGAAAGMAHLQKHAGFTRTGAGGVRHEDAHRWVVASWRQHTSRAGDPQLHIHQTILNKVRTERDGAWRTLDGQALYRERGAAAAISTLVMENQLAANLGVEFVNRADGHGREVKGVSQRLMDEFSSRARKDIGPGLVPLIAAYRDRYGHDPDEHALWAMGQYVSRDSREPKHATDPAQLVRDWAQRARERAGAELAPLTAQVCGKAQAQAQPLTLKARRDILARAVTGLQAKRSTFTESDLTRAISECLPAGLPVMDPQEAADLLSRLATEAIASGMVTGLEPPQWLDIPDGLRRADGQNVYKPHRAARYATDVQLRMETRITEAAADHAAPRADPDQVAALLGANRAALEAQLDPGTPADVHTVTGSGLLLSQAAAAFAILTSDQRVDVLIGPAGTGKSRTITTIATVWPHLHPGTRVIALTETQQAANLLRELGIADAHNISLFLTDRRLQHIPPGSLILIDEASMVTMTHLDQLTAIARAAGAKMPLAGDPAQHQAVEGGGGMAMLERRQGSLHLAEPLRFTDPWEREASLRLRAGDHAVIAEYDQRGRILADNRELILDECYRRWLADHLQGKDSVMITAGNADALELSRRARADLIRYGRVHDGPDVRLREGAAASAGDLIMARRNMRAQAVANRQVYQLLAVRPDGSATVRLQGTGTVKDLPAAYLVQECHLAYGVTSHAVQGATFAGNGYAVVLPSDDRHYLYTAMSRAAGGNYAFAVIDEPLLPAGAPAPAPEVARYRALAAEQSGELTPACPAITGTGVLTVVMERDNGELSATETLERAFSDADSLATLSRIWIDLAGSEYRHRYVGVLCEHLGPDLCAQVCADYRYTWLCRTLRAAELAGMNSSQVLAQAIGQGSLDDADSVAAVLDYRARHIIPGTLPLGGGWAARAPRLPDFGTDRLLARVGQAMDERISRLGDHVAATVPLWAERALGPVPDNHVQRQDWLDRAAAVEAYREMKGWHSPSDPIGPAPAVSAPEHRAAWHTALIALAKVDGINLSHLTEHQLHARRKLYAQETARAPLHPGRELRLSQLARDHAAVRASRARREASITTDTATKQQHLANAVRWTALRDRAAEAARLSEEAMATRQDWQRIAEPTLRIAQAADLELRRRDPWARLDLLKSMEPESDLIDGDPDARDADLLAALGLTPEATELSAHPQHTADAAREAQVQLDELSSLPQPEEDHELAPTEAWGRQAARPRQAIRQPSRPLVQASERLAELEASG